MQNSVFDSAQAFNEASRITVEASQRSLEGARLVADLTRSYVDQSATAAQTLMASSMAAGEAALKAAFQLQSAAIQASISYVETASSQSRSVAEQWADVSRQTQTAVLEALQANMEAAQKMATVSTPPANS